MYSFSFFIILLVGFVDLLGIGLVYPVFASLMFDQSAQVIPESATPAFRGAMLGLLIALTPLVQFISSPILGAISDVKGRKKVLAFGIGAGCVGYFLAIWGIHIESIWLLLLYRVCVGVSEGTIAVAQAALVDISTEENKSRRFSILGAALGFGFTVGPYIGGKLSDQEAFTWASYMLPFIVAGCMNMFNLVLVLTKFPHTRVLDNKATCQIEASLKSISKVFLWKNLRWVFVGGFALSYGWSAFQEFVPVFLKDRFYFSSGGVGDYYAFCGLWYALGSGILTAPIVKRFAAEKILPCALAVCSVGMIAFGCIPSSIYVWVLTPLLSYCMALAYPCASVLVSDRTHKDSQGEALGVYQSVLAAAMGLSPLLMGSLVGEVPVMAAWGGAAAMALGAASFHYARGQFQSLTVQDAAASS